MLIESPFFQIIAMCCLGPAIWAAVHDWPRGCAYWVVLTLAVIGPAAWCIGVLQAGWRTDFSFTIWISVATTLTLFSALALRLEAARRLTILALPYLAFLIGFAILSNRGDRNLAEPPDIWVAVHIVIAVMTYALSTLAAVAALSVFVKERALKAKRSGAVATVLPSVAEGENLQDRLMATCEVVLGLGLITGIAIHVEHGQPLLEPDHKTVLTFAAFAVIGTLLILQRYSGLRGRRAAQFVMIAYLLVTLAYPGVKFVTDVLSS
ncbi:MAG: cytochrome c biogenesis protein CcsA [Alphaproteobacteria bacterium]|nr:cytochrome c biogenesis protein CcsA [Alphaproteobacteria bacterium]